MGHKPVPKPHYTYRDSFPEFHDPRAFQAGDKIGYLIAYSGGCDSNILISQALDVTQDPELIQPFMMELVPDLEYAAYWREFAWKRWHVKVLPYQHWAFSWYIRRGIFQLRADPTYPRVVLRDIERAVRADTGLRWIGYGYKSIDSLQRRGMMNQWEYGISWDRAVFAPLKDWRYSHVTQYLARKHLSQSTDPALQSHGIDVSPKCMHWLREYWPGDYCRMLKAFPLAVAQADRWERLQASKCGPHGGTTGGFPDQANDYEWVPKDQMDDLPMQTNPQTVEEPATKDSQR